MKKLLVSALFTAFVAAGCSSNSCPDDTCSACEGDAVTACENAADEISGSDGFGDLSSDEQAAACSVAAIACGFGTQ